VRIVLALAGIGLHRRRGQVSLSGGSRLGARYPRSCARGSTRQSCSSPGGFGRSAMLRCLTARRARRRRLRYGCLRKPEVGCCRVLGHFTVVGSHVSCLGLLASLSRHHPSCSTSLYHHESVSPPRWPGCFSLEASRLRLLVNFASS
jgi:hypothetical protein